MVLFVDVIDENNNPSPPKETANDNDHLLLRLVAGGVKDVLGSAFR